MALVPCQVLRVAILLSYFSVLCNYKAIDMPAHQTYGGSWKFLTFINLKYSRNANEMFHNSTMERHEQNLVLSDN
ncbi:androgen-induced gene 1 protein isoform X6 [Sceloporus undulatus]|uniref:androgen-induced gene 1 protein isoform X6 n=1 Tax=Sceloporus undulatus TaxID=8520 RepID=UPI001C4DC310|nr:androgen-induced gene 1 protein isoform X6 [Sceloporus undulatus]